ncbi:MAG: exopolysaccharide biosynthesis protein [Rhodospirillaceae bacterium]|nr:exopolysaccharide biosynthesis protein [Rhodospirillaceae bacterium]
MNDRPRVADLLGGALEQSATDRITVEWLLGALGEWSFAVVMLVLGLAAVVPGTSTVFGIVLAIVSLQMVFARERPVLPRFLRERQVSAQRLSRLVARLALVQRWIERTMRRRWRIRMSANGRKLGLAFFVLDALLMLPIPFGQVAPGLAIACLALAVLEKDGALFWLALGLGALSAAIAAASMWAAFHGVASLGLL